MRDASAIHFTTEAEESEYREAGLPLKSSLIIPNGFDQEKSSEVLSEGNFREKFHIPEDKKIILFMSRLNWKKGLDTLVPTMKRVLSSEPNTVLVLAGSDDEGYGKQVRQLMDKSGLREGTDVVFTGMLLGPDKEAALRYADVFVLPSYSENFGIAVLDGLVHTAVVVTKGVAISSFINAYGAGIVVNKNEEELANGILKVLKNPSIAEQYKQRGKELVQKEFSSSEIAKRFLEGYDKLISHG